MNTSQRTKDVPDWAIQLTLRKLCESPELWPQTVQIFNWANVFDMVCIFSTNEYRLFDHWGFETPSEDDSRENLIADFYHGDSILVTEPYESLTARRDAEIFANEFSLNWEERPSTYHKNCQKFIFWPDVPDEKFFTEGDEQKFLMNLETMQEIFQFFIDKA